MSLRDICAILGKQTPHDVCGGFQGALRQLGGFLDMSCDFWRALALHPASCGTDNGGGLCNGGVGSPKGILKHGSGGGGTKRKGAVELATAAPPPLAARAKAYRKCVIDTLPAFVV